MLTSKWQPETRNSFYDPLFLLLPCAVNPVPCAEFLVP
jgi:hypothetical protein